VTVSQHDFCIFSVPILTFVNGEVMTCLSSLLFAVVWRKDRWNEIRVTLPISYLSQTGMPFSAKSGMDRRGRLSASNL